LAATEFRPYTLQFSYAISGLISKTLTGFVCKPKKWKWLLSDNVRRFCNACVWLSISKLLFIRVNRI